MRVLRRLFIRTGAVIVLVTVPVAPNVWAGPWMPPGDPALRHDIEVLADVGIVRAPIIAWPLSWGDIARDLSNVQVDNHITPAVRTVLERVKKRARWETEVGEFRIGAKVAVGENVRQLRTFEDTPREDGELALGADWTGDYLSIRLQATYTPDPADGEEWRVDGSYIGAAFGDWMFSAGLMDRWWGPGWDGSLIVSSNPRPIPAIAIERNFTDPFKPKWLRWVGPWDFSFFYGWLEEERAVPNTQIFGLRFDFRPTLGLQIGLSRTALWCGDGRPCDLQTFTDLLIGRSNLDEGVDPGEEPGDQRAGYDLRWAPPLKGRPLAFYTQWIGEDEAGGFPSKFVGLFGIEYWGSWRDSTYRIHLEYADTACQFEQSEPQFNCAYNNSFYPTGYRFRGQSIGHSADNDAALWSLGGILVKSDGNSWNVLFRWGELNRGGPPDDRNTVTPIPKDLANVEVSHRRLFDVGIFDFGIGYDRIEDLNTETTSDDVRAFVRWHRPY